MAELPSSLRVRFRLSVKLTLWLTTTTALVFSIFGYLLVQMQRRNIEQEIRADAESLSDMVWRSARYSMLRNDREALNQLVQELGRAPRLRNLRVTDADGRIRISRHAEDTGQLLEPSPRDGVLISPDPSGERLLVITRNIENHPDCSTAACHAHPPEQRNLGLIEARLTLADVDTRYAQLYQRLFWTGGLIALVVCAVGVTFLWRSVDRPVRELMSGTRRLAQGDLAHRIPVRSADELGALAASFNQMTAELASARQESSALAESLEQRVREKSEDLEKMYASLLASEEMATLGKVAAGVAHEVNSPVFAMLTYAKLAQKRLAAGDLTPDARAELAKHLDLIEQESKRCGTITSELLALARGRQPADRRQHELADINTVAQRALRLISHRLDKQGIELRATYCPDLPPVACDPGQIEQALLTLLVNSADAMPDGGILEMAVTSHPDEGTCSIRVRDTGPGIAEEDLPHVFDAFFTTKNDRHRAGLGLPIAKNIMDRHGGSITVASGAGPGAELTIKLPLKSAGNKDGNLTC